MEKIEKKIRLFTLLMIPLVIFWDFHWFEPAAKKNTQGINAYDKKDFNKSLQLFLEARGLKNSPQVINNTASALYQLKRFDKALNEYSKIDFKKMKIPEADVHYNMGNVLFKMKKYDKALEAYKKSLILNHSDLAAKKNYELTLKKIKEQKDKKDDQKDQKKQDQKKEDQKKQQQKKKDKHKNLMKYLNQNEKKQLKKKKRKVQAAAGRKKDW